MMDLAIVAITAGSAVAAAQIAYFALRRQASKLESEFRSRDRSSENGASERAGLNAIQAHLNVMSDIARNSGGVVIDNHGTGGVTIGGKMGIAYSFGRGDKGKAYGPVKPKKDGVKS